MAHGMNILFFIIRLLISTSLLTIAGGFYFIEHSIPTGTAALLLGAAILIPDLRTCFNFNSLLPATSMQEYMDMKVLFVAGLWTLGLILCVSAIGGFFTKDYGLAIAFFLTGMGLLFFKQVVALFKKDTKAIPVSTAPAAPAPQRAVPVATAAPAATTATDLQQLKEAFDELLTMAPHRRGYAFQDFLNKLFHDYHLDPRNAFRLMGEEIDGSFELDGHVYLMEAKWQEKPTGQADLLVFNGKVEGKSTWARGLFISYNGFSKEGLHAFARGKGTRIIGIDGHDIQYILNGQISLPRAINKKARRAVETNEFFVPISELI